MRWRQRGRSFQAKRACENQTKEEGGRQEQEETRGVSSWKGGYAVSCMAVVVQPGSVASLQYHPPIFWEKRDMQPELEH